MLFKRSISPTKHKSLMGITVFINKECKSALKWILGIIKSKLLDLCSQFRNLRKKLALNSLHQSINKFLKGHTVSGYKILRKRFQKDKFLLLRKDINY